MEYLQHLRGRNHAPGLTGGRRRKGGRLALVAAAAALSAAAAPTTASAYSTTFCGVLIAHTGSGGFNCFGPSHTLAYASARYTGGGTVNQIRATLTVGGLPYTGDWAVGNGTNFTSYCYNNPTSINVRGANGQSDGGANHTIYGVEDDSPNHTGCI